VHTIFWLENLKGRDHSEDIGVDGRIILVDSILGKYEGVSKSFRTESITK
jgi:hypothetical protein